MAGRGRPFPESDQFALGQVASCTCIANVSGDRVAGATRLVSPKRNVIFLHMVQCGTKIADLFVAKRHLFGESYMRGGARSVHPSSLCRPSTRSLRWSE